MRRSGELSFICLDCEQVSDTQFARAEYRKEGEFFLDLCEALEDLARLQIKNYGLYADSPESVYAKDGEGIYA